MTRVIKKGKLRFYKPMKNSRQPLSSLSLWYGRPNIKQGKLGLETSDNGR